MMKKERMEDSSVSTGSYYDNDRIIDSTADSVLHSQPPSPPSLSHENQEILETIRSFLLDETNIAKILHEILRSNDKKKRCTNTGVMRSTMMKKKITGIKCKNLSELVHLKETYSCKLCNEVFNDFRALGGHTAAHNRNKKVEKTSFDKLVAEEGGFGDWDGDGQQASSLAATLVDREKKYVCDLCSMRFSTGQALGGHKGYHRSATRSSSDGLRESDIPGRKTTGF